MNPTIIYILIAIAISFGLTVLALVDTLLKDFDTPKEKVIWHLIAIIPGIGWLIYLIFGYKKGKRKDLSQQ